MRLEYQILIALGLDLLLGDPLWLPHPVRLIGRLAGALEGPLRKKIADTRLAGVVTVAIVIGATGVATLAILKAAAWLHPALGTAASIALLYTTLAPRDLARHAMDVYWVLTRGDLAEARARVAMIVGRDTASLDERGVVRAAVESVAENTVDGVTAPLFFAALGGPIGAMLYKAISTLDSTFGYKNERYLLFGWASARLDDCAAFIPARLTLPLIALGAALTRMRGGAAWRIGLRDRRRHASPNAGIAEAAFAGSLGVRLGGPLYRKGKLVELPSLGDAREQLSPRHIALAVGLMLVTTLLAAAAFIGMRLLGVRLL